jgi:hypothetical protein
MASGERRGGDQGRGTMARFSRLCWASTLVAVCVVAQEAAAEDLVDFYGRWSSDPACPYFEIYIPGEDFFYGIGDRAPIIRKATFSITGRRVTATIVGNAGEMDSREVFEMVDRNTLRPISVEALPGKIGKRPAPPLPGALLKRCH